MLSIYYISKLLSSSAFSLYREKIYCLNEYIMFCLKQVNRRYADSNNIDKILKETEA